jgi:hypothetical protein
VQDGITHVVATPHCHRFTRLLRSDILPRVARLPTGTVDGLKFTLSEVDLRQAAMLVHLEVENVAVDPAREPRFSTSNPIQHYRIRMLTREGVSQKYSAMHIKEVHSPKKIKR